MRALQSLTAGLALLLSGTDAPAPVLVVDSHPPQEFTRAALLARPDLEHLLLDVEGAPRGEGAPHPLAAIRLSDLLRPFPKDAEGVEVGCADGFVARLPRTAALRERPEDPVAYLAIEEPDAPWPRLPPHADGGEPQDLGLLRIVWKVGRGQAVARELWPYQVVRLAPAASLAHRYPRLVPRGDPAAARGLQVFAVNCLACHALNHQGPAAVGPDLNLPQSPIEYLGRRRLIAYLRDPQSLHAWANERMPAFPPEVLAAGSVDDLLSYLAERARHR